MKNSTVTGLLVGLTLLAAGVYGAYIYSAPRTPGMPMTGTMNMGTMVNAASMPDMNMSGGSSGASMKGTAVDVTQARPALASLPQTPTSTVTRMGDLVMPPGMIMTPDHSLDAMQDMAAVDLRQVRYSAPANARGAQPLVPTVQGGVKVFNLRTSIIRWNILKGMQVAAYAVNQQVPGPTLRVTQGDRVRINVKNDLPESTTLHWHGLIVPNQMDGPADITQKPIPPGGSYTYAFTVQQAGTYFYHSHKNPDRQQGLGLYGALIVDPRTPSAQVKADLDYTLQLQEWNVRQGYTFPAMEMEGALPNYFTINGKAYPQTDTVRMKVGQTLKLRFIGTNNNFIHPMHVHGGPFEVVARDGETLKPSARFLADTVNVGPGQRYDVIWTARRPGKWLVHCHIPHHTTNNNVEEQGGGGLTMLIDVAG